MAMQLGAGVVHLQGFAVKVSAVESGDSLCRLGIGLHLNKPEASGQTGPAIRHHFGPPYRAVFLKYRSNVLFGNVRTEVPNENIVHKLFLSTGCFGDGVAHNAPPGTT